MTTIAFQEVGQLLLVSSFALINCAYKKLNIAISHLNNVKWQLYDTVYQSATVIHSIRIRCMTRGIMQWITMHIQMLTVTRNKILIFSIFFYIYVKLSSFYFQLQTLIAISLITSNFCVCFCRAFFPMQ